MKKLTVILLLIPSIAFAGINLIDKIVPKGGGFTGMVDGEQVLCGGDSGAPPNACFADVWINVDAGTLELPNSTTLPAACNAGEIYVDTNATSGQQLYGCEAGSWVLQGDGAASADDLDDVSERGDETDVWITVGGITAEDTVYATDYLIAGDASVDSGWAILYGGGLGAGGGTVKLYEENGANYAYIRATPSGFTGERVAYIPDASGTMVLNATGTEVDPQVGAVTNAKWCVGDGDSIECTEAAPAGVGDMTKAVYDADDDGEVGETESNQTWTLHDSYPDCCYAGTFVTCVGDTLTCDTPAGVLGSTVEDTEMAAEDFGDFTCTGGEDGCSVDDDSHAHTSATISGLDISADTNLAVTFPVVLTDDTVSMTSGYYLTQLSAVASTQINSGVSATEFSKLDTNIATILTDLSSVSSTQINSGVSSTEFSKLDTNVATILTNLSDVSGTQVKSAVPTATALAANPADCAANQFANAIAASGALTCAAIADADVPNDITINSSSVITSGVGFDAIGAVDLDYGSVDVTDHTFVTDSTGDGEIVLPADSIGPAEIDSTTGEYDFGGVTSFEIPNAADQTTNAAGEVAVDSSAAPGSGIRFYGDAAYTLPGTQSKSFVILNPVAASDYPVWATPYAITIKHVRLQCLGGTNIIGQLSECDGEGINCAVVDASDITATANNSVDDDGTLSNPSIDANDYVGWITTSISGTPTSATITFDFIVNQVN